MHQNIEALVKQHYDSLNDNDIHIWNYIVHNKQACSTIKIEQLADICHVSRTSILRFTKKISLNGFTELKFMLKQDIEDLRQLSEMDIDELNDAHMQSIQIIQNYDYTKACEILSQADRVFAYGIGEVFSGAIQILKSNLFLMERIITPIQGVSEMKFVIDKIRPQDAVILFTMSGNDPTTLDYAKQLKEKGCKVIAICGNRHGQINTHSDLCFYFLPIPKKIQIEHDEYIPSSLLYFFIELLFFKYCVYVQGHKEH